MRRYEDDWAKIQSGIVQDILKQAEEEHSLLKKRIVGKRKEIEVATAQLDDTNFMLRMQELSPIPRRAPADFMNAARWW